MDKLEEKTFEVEWFIMQSKTIFKRQLWVLGFISIALIFVLIRLAYIQLIGTENFSIHQVNLIQQAVEQRQQQMIIHSGRGEITDRDGGSLTGHSAHVLVFFPLVGRTGISEQKLEQMSEWLPVTVNDLRQQMKRAREPSIFQVDNEPLELTDFQVNQINQLNIPGVLALPYEFRYDPEHMLAQHFIGRIGQNAEEIRTHYRQELEQGTLSENSVIGIQGIEKSFQPFLQGIGPTALSYYVDGKGDPLSGMDVKYTEPGNPFYPLVVETTLDREIQEQLEVLIDAHGISEGAAVVLDIESSEILASVSRPEWTPHVNQSRAWERGAWENKVVKRYSPGSIFKTVIAAAALEQGAVTPDQHFQCDGVLPGTNFHCWKPEGHGQITFAEGFAESCNIVFGEVARELGPERIEEYAYKLGLLDRNGWHRPRLFQLEDFKQLETEERGQVYDPQRLPTEQKDPLYLLQTGIGQLDVQTTPLAVANMMATINKGGVKHQVKGVKDIWYQTGGSFYHFNDQTLDGSSISAYTAYQLQRLLREVVETGTASALNQRGWQASGKTGTAQVMDKDEANPIKNHRWFAGYYPVQEPKYAVVVLALNQEVENDNRSVQVFGELIDWLDENEGNKDES